MRRIFDSNFNIRDLLYEYFNLRYCQIGSHIAELLLQRGDKVMAIDNLATGRQEHLEAQERLTIVEDSIANVELMTRLFNEFRQTW